MSAAASKSRTAPVEEAEDIDDETSQAKLISCLEVKFILIYFTFYLVNIFLMS